MEKENIIVSKTIDFSLDVISFCEILDQNRKFIISNQLLKSGTSIGANIHEAQNAESRADFIYKLKIAAKEIEETKYWLILCEKSPNYQFEPILKAKITEIGLIVYKIISSSKSR